MSSTRRWTGGGETLTAHRSGWGRKPTLSYVDFQTSLSFGRARSVPLVRPLWSDAPQGGARRQAPQRTSESFGESATAALPNGWATRGQIPNRSATATATLPNEWAIRSLSEVPRRGRSTDRHATEDRHAETTVTPTKHRWSPGWCGGEKGLTV